MTDVPSEAAVRITTEALLMEGPGASTSGRGSRSGSPTRASWRRSPRRPNPGRAPEPSTCFPGEWEVLALVDGDHDVRGMAQAIGRSEFEVAKTLFGLESAGVVTLRDPGPVARADRPGSAQLVELTARVEDALTRRELEEARAAAERAATLFPHDPGAHVLLGRVHLAAARPGEAADAFRRALRQDPLLAPRTGCLGTPRGRGALHRGGRRLGPLGTSRAGLRTELVRRPDVHRAQDAAQTLAEARAAGDGLDG